MKTENLVNGYVLPNLFCMLLFLDDYGVHGHDEEWEDQAFVDNVIRRVIVSRFKSFTPETQQVVRNTLRYLTLPQKREPPKSREIA